MLIGLIVDSSCIHVSKHSVVFLKCIQFLFLNYTSVKLVWWGEDRKGGREKLVLREPYVLVLPEGSYSSDRENTKLML